MTERPTPKLVSIGSISVTSLLIEGFKDHPEDITAIVPTTDTGSSTGIIRERFSMPAPGDVRAVLAALGEKQGDKATLGRLLQYRFRSEHFAELHNMALGNLVLAALTDMLGSFSEAVRTAGELLGVKGRVLPVTTVNTHLAATLDDGQEIEGEKEVRRVGKSAIKTLFLKNGGAKLGEGVAESIMEADMMVIGPGCFYTSIIACLVVPGMQEALQKTTARKIFCCNTTTTPGQTDNFRVFEHVEMVVRYLDHNPPEYVLINSEKPHREMEEVYCGDSIFPLLPAAGEIQKIKSLGCIPIAADLIEEDWAGKRKTHKLDSIRHDPRKVRTVLMAVYRGEYDLQCLNGKASDCEKMK